MSTATGQKLARQRDQLDLAHKMVSEALDDEIRIQPFGQRRFDRLLGMRSGLAMAMIFARGRICESAIKDYITAVIRSQ